MNTKNNQSVTGVPSRAAATRVATLMMVVPSGVLAFQNDDNGHVELRTHERCATVDVDPEGVRLVTKVGRHSEREVFETSDREAARRLIRFFGTAR